MSNTDSSKNVKVMVSGAAGQIAYSLLPLIASGSVFGNDVMVHLRLLDITPMVGSLKGVEMELIDGAYPNLASVLCTDNAEIALKDCDVAVFVGGFPRKAGMVRKDLIAKNSEIFAVQGKALEKVASKNVKILVVANPANTNCLILRHYAPSIPATAFTCLTRLDHNRALSQIAMKVGTKITNVKNVTIWGNHSDTQVPDALTLATVDGKNVPSVANKEWLEGEFMKTVQLRGKAIIDARKLSSAMSAANAAADHLRTWLVTGTPEGDTVSMGVVSDGSYGIKEGIIYSFPCKVEKPGSYTIIKDWKVSQFIKEKMIASEKELLQEQSDALETLSKL